MQSERPNYPPEYTGIRRNLLLATTTLLLSCFFLRCVSDGAIFNGLHFDVGHVEIVRLFIFAIALYEWRLFDIMGQNIRKKWLRGDQALSKSYEKIVEIDRRLGDLGIKTPEISSKEINDLISILTDIRSSDREQRNLVVSEIKSTREKVKKQLEVTAEYKDVLDHLRDLSKKIGQLGAVNRSNFENIYRFEGEIKGIRHKIDDLYNTVGELIDSRKLENLLESKNFDLVPVVELKNKLNMAASLSQTHSDTQGILSSIYRTLKGIDKGVKSEIDIFDRFPAMYFYASSSILVGQFLLTLLGVLESGTCAAAPSP